MLKFYIAQKKMWQTLINVVYFIQIVLFIIIFFVTLRWFLELINIHCMQFVEPLSNFLSGLVKLFYKKMIEVGGVQIDGSILLFDFAAFLFIFGGSRLVTYFDKRIKTIDIMLDKAAREEEEKFNQQLQDDYEKQILGKSNVGILISYSLKNIMGNAFWSERSDDLKEHKNEEVDKQIYYALSKLKNCKVAKSGSQFLVLCNRFESIDNILDYITTLLAQVDGYVMKDQLTLTTYVAVQPYKNKDDTKKVFTTLNKLLSLKMPGDVVCFGDFQLRYEFLENRQYITVLKGTYDIDENCKVWALVKKN